MSSLQKAIQKNSSGRSADFPIGTIAFYGPTDRFATKVAVGVVDAKRRVIALERWFSSGQDVREDEEISRKIAAFLQSHHVSRIVMSERIIGCPHEEGIDYPEGGTCPKCPFWAGRDRWTGKRL